jgi:hypothetical protein
MQDRGEQIRDCPLNQRFPVGGDGCKVRERPETRLGCIVERSLADIVLGVELLSEHLNKKKINNKIIIKIIFFFIFYFFYSFYTNK